MNEEKQSEEFIFKYVRRMNTKDQKNAHQQSFENSTQESPNFSPLSQMNPMFSQIQPWNPSTFYPKRPEFVCFMHGFYAVIGGLYSIFDNPGSEGFFYIIYLIFFL
jgi:hypothetical protein